jgi:hypothetical protein
LVRIVRIRGEGQSFAIGRYYIIFLIKEQLKSKR